MAGFRKNDNAFLAVDDVKALQAAADRLSPAIIRGFRTHLLDGGVGPRTVNKTLTLLGALFKYAIRHEWLETNPVEGTKLRGSSRRSHDLVEANIFAPPEIQALLGVCQSISPHESPSSSRLREVRSVPR